MIRYHAAMIDHYEDMVAIAPNRIAKNICKQALLYHMEMYRELKKY